MQIRPCETADLRKLGAIYGWYVEQSYATFALEAPSAKQWASDWEIARERGFPWLVGVEQGEVIGYTNAGSFFPRPAYDSTVVSSIYLEQAYVGRGLGRPLYEAAIEALRSSGFHLAVAGITLPNRGSLVLHETLGFTPVGTFREVGYKLGAWRDVSWWQLPLH